MTAPRADIPPQIGPYPVLRKLGEGSFGEVFLAKQLSVGRFVAIKRARPRKGSDHDAAAFLSMFFAEKDVIAKLEHANIVSIIDAGQDGDGSPYIVMEYVQARSRTRGPAPSDVGGLLHKWRRFEPLDAAYICAGVAQALAHAHHEGVIHRDVKPSNVLISGLGEIKLTDFGIAKIQRAGQYAPTSTEHLAGSPPYMAPELYDDSSDRIALDHRVDLWALGVVAWELVCGFRPFEDEAFFGPKPENVLAELWVRNNARKGRRRTIHDAAPHVPEAFRSLIEECLQPLERRLTTADEFFSRLIDAQLGLPTYRKTFLRLFINDTMPASDQMDHDDPQHATGEIDPSAVFVASAGATDPSRQNNAPVPPAPSPAPIDAPASMRAALGLLEPGDRFDKWEILRKLGEGGMAIVYDARRTTSLGAIQRAALKVIRPEHTKSKDGASFVERFIAEAQIAMRLTHQNIVSVFDAGAVDGVHYIAMAYIEGCDLESLLLKYGKRLPPHIVAFIGYELAAALTFAHASDVIHRDVAPKNLLAMTSGGVVLNDWGISKPTAADGRAAKTTHAAGTPYYMPPEQIRGDAIDGRADLFAAGASLYEMLAGVTPFQVHGNPDETVEMLLYRIFHNDRPPIAELAPHAHPELLATIERLVQKHPHERLASAQALMAALEPLVQPQARRHLAELVKHRDAPVERRMEILHAIAAEGGWPMPAASGPRSAVGTVRLPGSSPSVAAPLPSSPNAPAVRPRLLPIALGAALLTLVALVGFGVVLFSWPRDPAGDNDRSNASPAPIATQPPPPPQPALPARVDSPAASEQAPPSARARPTVVENANPEPQNTVEQVNAPPPQPSTGQQQPLETGARRPTRRPDVIAPITPRPIQSAPRRNNAPLANDSELGI